MAAVMSVCTMAALLSATPAAAASTPMDASQSVGPETCAKCHDREYEVWQGTKHAHLFTTEPLHLRPRAQEIGRKLGVPLIKSGNSVCLNCHFTPKVLSGRVLARAGVSCESCHGAALRWVFVHNTFDGHQVHRASESPADRRRRQDANFRAGMRAGGHIYELVSHCYQCHMVPEERLVNVGGHSGGGDFDLVERFDKIRHNFVTGGRQVNAPISPERRRQLYVLGLALELEYSLRGVAEAKESGGVYVAALSRDVEKVRKKIRKVQRLAALPQLEAAFAAADGLRLEAGNAAEVGYAVDKVAAAAKSFAEQEDGSRLAALDPLFQPEPEEAAPAADQVADEGAAAAPDSAAGQPAGGPGGGVAAVGQGRAGAAVGSVAPSAAGGRRPAAAPSSRGGGGGGGASPGGHGPAHIWPAAAGKMIGPDGCSASCHPVPTSWWFKDKHQKAADPFLNHAQRNRQIATFYYGKPADDILATGKGVCMDCHGTVLTGKGAEEVETGVSCESCHGPAGAYRETHKDKKSHGERVALG